MRKTLAEVALWVYVVALGLQLGAGLYETRVVTPLWSRSPPESVRGWNAEARYAVEPRARFWRYCTPAVGLAALLALVYGLTMSGRRRVLVVASSAVVVALILVTYGYFAPTLASLLERRGEGLSDEEVTARVSGWLWLGRARAVLYVAAWLAALKALSMSGSREV